MTNQLSKIFSLKKIIKKDWKNCQILILRIENLKILNKNN